jgi:N-acetylglucosaminyldiphosphoundecaprenol N-acetyl-beta-D-mannosaminyltransferase
MHTNLMTDTITTAKTAAPLQQKRRLLKSYITTGKFNEFVEQVFWLTDNKESSYICFANVHMLVEAYQDPAFNKILNEADVASPDGGPLSKLMKVQYGQKQDRVPGMDLMPRLIEEAAARGKSVFFYGSTDDVLEAVVATAKAKHPSLRVAGHYSPPFRQLTEEEDQSIVDMINATGADLVFVALGCPKQERWMAEHKGRVQACMLGVGQAYMTYAGLERRLPKWARDWSLEWTYRLYQEPKRLWKRYLVTNSTFVYLTMKDLLLPGNKHRKTSSVTLN